MGMVSHGNSDVRMQALLAIQKMMVQNWLVCSSCVKAAPYLCHVCVCACICASIIMFLLLASVHYVLHDTDTNTCANIHICTHMYAQGIFRSAADRGYSIHTQDSRAALNMRTLFCVLFCSAASVMYCGHQLSIAASLQCGYYCLKCKFISINARTCTCTILYGHVQLQAAYVRRGSRCISFDFPKPCCCYGCLRDVQQCGRVW